MLINNINSNCSANGLSSFVMKKATVKAIRISIPGSGVGGAVIAPVSNIATGVMFDIGFGYVYLSVNDVGKTVTDGTNSYSLEIRSNNYVLNFSVASGGASTTSYSFYYY